MKKHYLEEIDKKSTSPEYNKAFANQLRKSGLAGTKPVLYERGKDFIDKIKPGIYGDNQPTTK